MGELEYFFRCSPTKEKGQIKGIIHSKGNMQFEKIADVCLVRGKFQDSQNLCITTIFSI